MKLILEIDGPVLDVAPAWHRVHLEAAAAVGWSALDQTTFWRLTRKDGQSAVLLPGASPLKLKKYQAHFTERIDTDEVVGKFKPHEEMDRILASLATRGSISLVTLSANLQARKGVLDGVNLTRLVQSVDALDPDSRNRTAELRELVGGEKRCIVAAASDTLVRAAADLDAVAVGVSRGPCSVDRLRRAGATVVFKELDLLRAAILEDSEELLQAGLLPPKLG